MVDLKPNIKAAVDNLLIALNIGMVSFFFPLQIFLGFLYAKLTKRVYTFSIGYFIDIAMTVCVAIWYWKFTYYK